MNIGLTTIALATIGLGTLFDSETLSKLAGPGFLLLFGTALRSLGTLVRRRMMDAAPESASATR